MTIRDGWLTLRSDGVFWAAMAMIIAVWLPYFLPIMTEDQLWDWGWIYGDIPISIATVLVLGVGLRRLPAGAERRLWQWVLLAFGLGLVAEVLNAILPETLNAAAAELVVDVLYLMYYLALFLAPVAAIRSARSDAMWTPQVLRHVGLGFAAVGFLTYAQTIPYHANPTEIGSYPGLFLYAILDVALVVTFLRVRAAQTNPRLRSALAWLAAVNVAYAVVDATDAIHWLEVFYYVELSPYWDLVWSVPEVILVVGARLFIGRPDGAVIRGEPWYDLQPDRGSLVFALAALPIAHALFSYLNVTDPALRPQRDGVIVIYVLLVGAFVLLYFRAIERLRGRATRELEFSEERYRSFAHARTDGLYRFEADAPIDLNGAPDEVARHLSDLALSEDTIELVGPPWPAHVKPGTRLGSVLSDAGLEPSTALQSWLAEGCRGSWQVSFEVAGRRRYEVLSLIAIVDDGALHRAWLTRVDATSEEEARAEAEALMEALRRSKKFESLGTLAGGIAHDFNNLLQPIVGFTEMAREELSDDSAAAQHNLDRVLEASGRAADLVEQILAVSQDRPRTIGPVDLNSVVEDALSLVRSGLLSEIEIRTDLQPDLPRVDGDSTRLHQVVMNLCTNSAQALGGQPGWISVETRSLEADTPSGGVPDSVELVVRDSGPGVPEHLHDRVFEPFFTTKPVGEGTGLGLSVVRGIAVGHGGDVRISREPEGGTRISVVLPAGTISTPAGSRVGSDTTDPLRVLVVDDDAEVAAVTKNMLEAEGHRVEAFLDPRRALVRVREAPSDFDVVVTDSLMPHMSGEHLVRQLRDESPDLGFVVSSGFRYRDEAAGEAWVELAKPFLRADLTRAVTRAHRQAGD